MSQFQGPQPPAPDGEPRRDDELVPSFDELVMSSQSLDSPHRSLHTVYLSRCAKRGDYGYLETHPNRFEPEDRAALQTLGATYARVVRELIQRASPNADPRSYAMRTLHPTVLDEGEDRCRTFYAEILDGDLRPVAVDSGCVEHLSRGAPVGALIYSRSDGSVPFALRLLISEPAFEELADRASLLSLERIREEPLSSLLMGLVFANLNSVRSTSSPMPLVTPQDIEKFEVRRKKWGVEFRFQARGDKVVASSRLLEETLEPLTVVYRELGGAS